MYGVDSNVSTSVKEIRCLVLVPQIGSHLAVTLPNLVPEAIEHNHDLGLGKMEPLGWIHTQSKEFKDL